MISHAAIAIGGVALGALGAAWWFMSDKGKSSSAHLSGKIVPGSVGSPAPDGLVPKSGYASDGTFEWAYQVGPGDSTGAISEAITGDDGRYQELLLANPELETIGNAGTWWGEHAWDAQTLNVGEILMLPLPWSRWIDQTGAPRGQYSPFPQDPREQQNAPQMAAPSPAAAAFAKAAGRELPPGTHAPYGELVAIDEAA
jgi:hypothetical protein